MNRIQLVNSLSIEASIAGNGVTTTNSQSGENQRLVSWIDQAYEDIQTEYADWKFLKAKSSFDTQVGVNIIQPAGDLNVWDIERIFGPNGEPMPVEISEEVDYFIDETITGEPTKFILQDDNTLMAYPKPETVKTFTYSYFKSPHIMTADTDTPAFPAQFHRAIVGRALIYYGNFELAPEMIQQGTFIYQSVYHKLLANQACGERRLYELSASPEITVVAQ
tara:strand:- start:1227 stop:1889 length:663 start_codon:yes stop_codon:yes gene_type:complete